MDLRVTSNLVEIDGHRTQEHAPLYQATSPVLRNFCANRAQRIANGRISLWPQIAANERFCRNHPSQTASGPR
jgi:hypothetical protein